MQTKELKFPNKKVVKIQKRDTNYIREKMCLVRKEISAEHGFCPEATHVASCCFSPYSTSLTLSELLQFCEALLPVDDGNDRTRGISLL